MDRGRGVQKGEAKTRHNSEIQAYQWRQTFICMPSENRKPTMGASIRCSKSFAKRMDSALFRFRERGIRACDLALLKP